MLTHKLKTFLTDPVGSLKSKRKNRKADREAKLMQPENFNKLSDKKAVMLRYKMNFGNYPDLRHPKTYNEKLQWLKLYYRKPEFTGMVDKYEVKKIVAAKIGEEYIIPTLGVWDRAEDIDFDALPDRFVLKCTHDSASVTICRDKSALDIPKVRENLNKCLGKSLFLWGREWPYKNVKPRIIAEEYMEDAETGELRDYKFFCFDGKVKAMYIGTERQKVGGECHTDYFDENGAHLPLRNAAHSNAPVTPPLPLRFEEMKKIAAALSSGFPHLRVDLYECNGKIYFGETTFFQGSGFSWFNPPEWDETFGSWLTLPKKKIKNK